MPAPAVSAPALPTVPPSVIEELRRGNKIGAIKAYHDSVKCSLKEAKDFVDQLETKLGIA